MRVFHIWNRRMVAILVIVTFTMVVCTAVAAVAAFRGNTSQDGFDWGSIPAVGASLAVLIFLLSKHKYASSGRVICATGLLVAVLGVALVGVAWPGSRAWANFAALAITAVLLPLLIRFWEVPCKPRLVRR